MSEPLTYTIVATAKIMGLSRASTYEAARRGELPIVRIGRRILVSRAALHRMLDVGEAPQ